MYALFYRLHATEVPERTKRLEDLCNKIEKQTEKNEKLICVLNEYDVPKVDVYIELKLSLFRLEKREEIMLRQKSIDTLKKKNAKSMAKKQLKETRPASKLSRRPTKYTTVPGKVFHGKTFNIVYSTDLIK